MPGVAPERVDITLERRVLAIRGRSAIGDHAGYRRVYTEYADGDYATVFTLSENIVYALGKHRPGSHRGYAEGRCFEPRSPEG